MTQFLNFPTRGNNLLGVIASADLFNGQASVGITDDEHRINEGDEPNKNVRQIFEKQSQYSFRSLSVDDGRDARRRT